MPVQHKLYSYEYDTSGNQTKKTEQAGGETYVTTYAYDALNRLTGTTEPDGTATAYSFDNNGNISGKTITSATGAASSITYTHNAANQLTGQSKTVGGSSVGAVAYTYDQNGNRIKAVNSGQYGTDVLNYTYDEWNRLTGFSKNGTAVASYTYNAHNERTSKTVDGVTTKYYWDDSGYVLNEGSGTGITASNFIGVDGIFRRQAGSSTYQLMKNGHGDVTRLLAGSTVSQSYDYDAYGLQKEESTSDANPLRYCGEYTDEETGFIYLRNRYYDPSTERFISEDPAQDGTNWYAYCGGNPVNRWDPLGLEYGKLRDFVEDYNVAFNGNVSIKLGELDGKGFAYVTLGDYQRTFYFDGTILSDGIYDAETDSYMNQEYLQVADNIDGTLYLQRSDFVAAMRMTEDGTATVNVSDEFQVSSTLAIIDFATYVKDAASSGGDIMDISNLIGISSTMGKVFRNAVVAGNLTNRLKFEKVLSAGKYRAESVTVKRGDYTRQVLTLYGTDSNTKGYQYYVKQAFFKGIPSAPET